jgi:hypothetical protein
MRDDGAIERNLILRQATFLRKAAERGFSIALIETETGIPATTLASYIDKPSRKASLMPLSAFIKIAAIDNFPDDLLSLLIEDSKHDVIRRDAEASSFLELGAKAGSFAAKVCQFQATGGHIDHAEKAELIEDLREFVSEGQGAILG